MARCLSSIEECRRVALRRLPRFVFDYIDGGADDEHTLDRNRRDLDALTLTPRILRDTQSLDTSVTILGSSWRLPFAFAPTGLNGLICPGGDIKLAAAAAAAGVPFILSTASNTRLEEVRRAIPDAELWMQLYVMQDRGIAEQIVARAQSAGYRALVLTVDVPVSGFRRRDFHNGFRLPLKPSPRLVFDLLTHPVWAWKQLLHGAPGFANLVPDSHTPLSAQAQAALLARAMDRSLDWESLHWLRGIWKGPLLLKGVLHPDDAVRSLDYGVDGLIVSNHGGRQFDGAPSSISSLQSIAAAIDGRVPLIMDSGIRSGTDILRAVASGAQSALIGRPVLYGLAAEAQTGVEFVLSELRSDLERSMTLLGLSRIEDALLSFP